MPGRACVHALEVLDHFEHADLAMALDEGLEPLRDLVELLGRRPEITISTAAAPGLVA